jgi:hypothetical protein
MIGASAAAAAAGLGPGAGAEATGKDPVLRLNGRRYWVQNCGAPRALRVDPVLSDVRFELRPGDLWHGTERTEIACTSELVKARVAFEFMIEPGAANTAEWLVLSQFWQRQSPSVAMELEGEALRFVVRADGIDYLRVREGIALARGHYHAVRFDIVSGARGGALDVEMDGEQVVRYRGPLGYALPGYWKSGIYRAPGAETLVMHQRNLTVAA